MCRITAIGTAPTIRPAATNPGVSVFCSAAISRLNPPRHNSLVRVFLADAYRTRLRGAGKTVNHPIAVGWLLTDDVQPLTVVVAGLLHDVLERWPER